MHSYSFFLSCVLATQIVACSSSGDTERESSPTESPDGGGDESKPTPTPPADQDTEKNADTPDASEAKDEEGAFAELPVSAGEDSPVVAAVTIQCADDKYELSDSVSTQATFPAAFAKVVSVTDPQGAADIQDVTQQLVVYPSLDAKGGVAQPFTIESYGIFFDKSQAKVIGFFAGSSGAAVRKEMCKRDWWPGAITVADNTGHVTHAKIRIPIVH